MADEVEYFRDSDQRLTRRYDVALLDLDGVVYIGAAPVVHAVDALERARVDGMRLAFVTNNAARPPSAVARHLTELGIAAEPDAVITSAQAAAHYLADRLPVAANVLVVGTIGLIEALRERGLNPVFSADDDPVAVVQGYSPDTDWAMLAEGAIAIRRGALWVASNLDATVPSARGPLPGNGSLVAALRHATGMVPVATGKPDPTMHRETVERTQARTPLVVGDRLDTDIEGATAVGCHSLLVLTGVTSAAELVTAEPSHRPDYVARDLRGLLAVQHAPHRVDGAYRDGNWSADEHLGLAWDSSVAPRGDSEQDDDDLAALRVVCAAAWDAFDHGQPAVPHAEDERARAAFDRLGLAVSLPAVSTR
jgi:glycerol-1-phosphatase